MRFLGLDIGTTTAIGAGAGAAVGGVRGYRGGSNWRAANQE